MKLYLVRHGQTDWNIKKQAQGVADIELNATGIAQAEALRDRIAAEDLHFDVVYASPLRRARKTAEIITNNRPDIIYDDRLVERSYGDLEGKIVDWDALGVDDLDIRQNTNIHNLEPVQTVLARSKSFLDDLKSLYTTSETPTTPDSPATSSTSAASGNPDLKTSFKRSDEPHILVVAPGTLLKTLHYNIVGYNPDTDLRSFHLDNCELVEYEV